MKRTLVFGASIKPHRYSNLALKRLVEKGIDTVAFGRVGGTVHGIEISSNLEEFQRINTITMYMRPDLQRPFYEQLIGLHPRRVIFNPGSENPEFYKLLEAAGIQVLEACTLVMLATDTY